MGDVGGEIGGDAEGELLLLLPMMASMVKPDFEGLVVVVVNGGEGDDEILPLVITEEGLTMLLMLLEIGECC